MIGLIGTVERPGGEAEREQPDERRQERHSDDGERRPEHRGDERCAAAEARADRRVRQRAEHCASAQRHQHRPELARRSALLEVHRQDHALDRQPEPDQER